MGPAAAFKGASGAHASTVPQHGPPCSRPPCCSRTPAQTRSPQSWCCGFLTAGTQSLHLRLSCPVPSLTDGLDPVGGCMGNPSLNYCTRKLAVRSGPMPGACRAGAPSPQEKRRSVTRLASAQRPASPRAGPSRGKVTSVGTGQPLLRKPRAAEGPLKDVAQGTWAGKPRLEG